MAKPKKKTKTKAKAKTKAKPKKAVKKTKAKAKAKPKTKAAKKPKAKPARESANGEATTGTPPSSEHLAELAKKGDLEVLFGLVDGSVESGRDVLVYKWLAVASDFGHAEADDMIGDLLEASSLRYDDDQFETGNAHWELGLAYLTGGEGLPRDLDKARSQLASAKERQYPMSVQESDTLLAQARARLDPEALAVFDAVYDGGAAPGVIDDREDEGDDDGDDEEEDG